MTVRADAGFWSYAMLDTLDKLGVGWSITTKVNNKVRSQIDALDQDAWTPIGYPPDGQAQVGETVMSITNPRKRSEKRTLRLVVRRTRLTGHQAQLFPDWRYHAFVTNLNMSAESADRHHQPHAGEDHQPSAVQAEPGELPTVQAEPGELPAVQADRYHRRHAACELAIRDLKDTGLAHLPSGHFNANAAWLLTAALAHNLYRHIPLLGRTQPSGRLIRGRTIRHRLFGIPGRLVNHRGKHILRLPARWPWAGVYLTALANLRRLPLLA